VDVRDIASAFAKMICSMARPLPETHLARSDSADSNPRFDIKGYVENDLTNNELISKLHFVIENGLT
jgi:hypothetical protein